MSASSHEPAATRPGETPSHSIQPEGSGPAGTDNSFHRLVGALVAPQHTFESLGRRPTWLIAWLVLVVCVALLGWAVHERTDYREVVVQTLEAGGMTDRFDAGEIDDMVEARERFGDFGAALGAVVAGGIFCLIALFYWIAFRLLGSELSYKESLATFVHGSLPTVVFTLLAVPVVLSGGDLTTEQVLTRNLLASNLSVFAPEEAGLALESLLSGLDFFALWSVVLLAIGYRVVARVSTAVAAGTVTVFFVLGLALRVGLVWLFGGGAA